eukprot:PITA_30375
MKDGDSVTEHLNAFNTVVSQLASVDIKISDEYKCIMLCSLPNLWDILVIEIGSNATTLHFDEIVSSLLTEEMRWKNMERKNGDALFVVCWKCGNEGQFKRDYKSKALDKGKVSYDAPSTEAKSTSDEGGDVYLASSSTHVDHEAWLIDSGASFHFTPHREWFCKYEKYDGGDVFLGMTGRLESLFTEKSPSSVLEDKTPQELWTSKKPSLSHLRIFGCNAYVHVPKKKRTKLDSKYGKCIFIGYKDSLKGNKLWNPVTRKVVYSQDVVFTEVKDVIKHEVQQKEPEKIKFELEEEESDSTAEEESEDEDPQTLGVRRSV